jgi:hypothetical protein
MGRAAMKRLCGDVFHGPPDVDEAECDRKRKHTGRHRGTWEQSDFSGTKRATVTVEWEDVD